MPIRAIRADSSTIASTSPLRSRPTPRAHRPVCPLCRRWPGRRPCAQASRSGRSAPASRRRSRSRSRRRRSDDPTKADPQRPGVPRLVVRGEADPRILATACASATPGISRCVPRGSVLPSRIACAISGAIVAPPSRSTMARRCLNVVDRFRNAYSHGVGAQAVDEPFRVHGPNQAAAALPGTRFPGGVPCGFEARPPGQNERANHQASVLSRPLQRADAQLRRHRLARFPGPVRPRTCQANDQRSIQRSPSLSQAEPICAGRASFSDVAKT